MTTHLTRLVKAYQKAYFLAYRSEIRLEHVGFGVFVAHPSKTSPLYLRLRDLPHLTLELEGRQLTPQSPSGESQSLHEKETKKVALSA